MLDSDKTFKAIKIAVDEAIDEIGIEGVRAMSMFPSAEKPKEKVHVQKLGDPDYTIKIFEKDGKVYAECTGAIQFLLTAKTVPEVLDHCSDAVESYLRFYG